MQLKAHHGLAKKENTQNEENTEKRKRRKVNSEE
jgi:hypothetical protein